ncbi:hypothetical protein D9757_003096 [Collybiopsis confluens]|uniref:Uncharacterized protein n=1 Tax=Collybiopsis confluens TaxID=2823264 RepID=A0A8H5HX47_9AGAR|nr:hypothetical protein D9757_003096 [Collybiopsis confluens]
MTALFSYRELEHRFILRLKTDNCSSEQRALSFSSFVPQRAVAWDQQFSEMSIDVGLAEMLNWTKKGLHNRIPQTDKREQTYKASFANSLSNKYDSLFGSYVFSLPNLHTKTHLLSLVASNRSLDSTFADWFSINILDPLADAVDSISTGSISEDSPPNFDIPTQETVHGEQGTMAVDVAEREYQRYLMGVQCITVSEEAVTNATKRSSAVYAEQEELDTRNKKRARADLTGDPNDDNDEHNELSSTSVLGEQFAQRPVHSGPACPSSSEAKKCSSGISRSLPSPKYPAPSLPVSLLSLPSIPGPATAESSASSSHPPMVRSPTVVQAEDSIVQTDEHLDTSPHIRISPHFNHGSKYLIAIASNGRFELAPSQNRPPSNEPNISIPPIPSLDSDHYHRATGFNVNNAFTQSQAQTSKQRLDLPPPYERFSLRSRSGSDNLINSSFVPQANNNRTTCVHSLATQASSTVCPSTSSSRNNARQRTPTGNNNTSSNVQAMPSSMVKQASQQIQSWSPTSRQSEPDRPRFNWDFLRPVEISNRALLITLVIYYCLVLVFIMGRL